MIKKYIASLILVITLLIPSTVLASDITNSIYFGQVRVTNNGTATSNVSGVFSNNSTAWISAGFMNATATDIAIRGSSSVDKVFMPGYADGVWSVFVDDAPAGNKDLTLYTNATAGEIRYFPSSGGMTVPDDASLELSDNFTMSWAGYFDTDNGTDKSIAIKPDAFDFFVSPTVSENVTAYILDISTLIMLPDGVGSITNLNVVNPGGAHWSTVDETPAAPNDADYVGQTGVPATEEDKYTTTSPVYAAGTPYTVDNVTVHFRYLNMVGATHAGYTPLLELYGENTTGSTIDATGGASVFIAASETLARPGGGLWSISDLEDLQVGIRIFANGTAPKCSQLSLLVAYTFADAEVSATGVTSGEYNIAVEKQTPFYGLGIDNDTFLPTTANITINLPLWQNDLTGTPISTIDYNEYTVIVTGTSWTTQGRVFNGTTDSLNLGDVTELSNTPALTVHIWFAQDILDVNDYLLDKWITGPNITAMNFQTFSDGNLYTRVRSVGADAFGFFDYSPVVTANEFSLYTMVYDGSKSGVNADTLKVYIDTIQQILSFTGTIPATTANMTGKSLYIGNDSSELNALAGTIGDNIIYNRVSSQSDINQYYNATKSTYDNSQDIKMMSTLSPVPDNTENWLFIRNNVMPYMESANISVNGVKKGSWAWEYAATFTDGSGNGNTATPTFRTASSDADVSIALISFGPLEKAEVDADTAITWPGFGVTQGAPDAPGTTYTENTTPGMFFAPLVHSIWNGTGAGGFIPVAVFWYWFAFFGILFWGMVVYWAFADKGQQALLIKIVVMTAIMTFWALPGPNIYGLYIVVYFVLWSFGILVLSKSFGW